MESTFETQGFIIEFDDNIVKFFTLSYGVLTRNRSELNGPVTPKLSGWYDISDTVIIPFVPRLREQIEMDNFKVWQEGDTELYAQVLAIGPNLHALPKKMRQKWKGAVWSPILKHLNDVDKVFSEISGDNVAEVVVKYDPSGDKLFKVIRLVEWEHEPEDVKFALYRQTPWLLEYLARYMRPIHEVKGAELVCIDKTRFATRGTGYSGVCIAHDAPNPTYDRKAEGSPINCAWLWSPCIGLIRWLSHQPENRVEMLGKWYTFKLWVTSARKDAATLANSQEYSCFLTVASEVIELVPIKPTIVRQDPDRRGEFLMEMEVSFPFRKEDIELPSQKTAIRKDAHFFDVDLGRVKIPVFHGQRILEIIRRHQNSLCSTNKEVYNRLKDETLIIVGTVGVSSNIPREYSTYPEPGAMFWLKSVDRIHYLHGGRNIFENGEFVR